MNRTINYPIKYAVLEVKEKGGYIEGYRDVTQGFIVSKCYVVESIIEYLPDGSNRVSYNVVFPFEDISLFKQCFEHDKLNIGKDQVPRYDACSRPYPIRTVEAVFDTYDDAKYLAEQKNRYHRTTAMLDVPVTAPDREKAREDAKNLFDQRLAMCYVYEQVINQATEDMEISEQLMTNGEGRVVKVLKPIKRNI